MNDRYNRSEPSSRDYRSAPRQNAPYGQAPRSRFDDGRRPAQQRPAGDRAYARPQQSRPQGAHPQQPRPQQVQPRNPQPQRRPQQPRVRKKSGGNVVLKVLKGIAFVFLAVFALFGKMFSGLNRKLDVFRRSEASAVIVNCIASAVVVMILLCGFALCKPSIDASRAGSLAAKGNVIAANRIINTLERKEYPAEKLAVVRGDVVEGFIRSGEYAAAESLISDMPEGTEKTEMTSRSNYAKAVSLYEEGDYTSAAQIFYQMTDYQDSNLRYADCRCALAIEAWQQGDETSARSLLLDVPDMVQRVSAAALKVTGTEAGAQAVLAADLFSTDNLNRLEETMQHLNEARSDMPEGRVAAGRYHTVALKRDGTLLCTGDNSLGQLNCAGWSGITQLAAGAFHTVGLRVDGTVLATGDNSEGQCEVSGWTDIVAVAAGACDTIGLKSDGTVVAAGKNAAKVSGWHNVTFVTGGSYSLGCLYDKGAMLSSHKGAQMGMGVTLYDLSVCGPVSVGVLYDGSMVSSFDGAPEWTNMVSVTACESGILGIDVNGRVLSHFYRPGDVVDFAISGQAVEVESSGTHHVVLASDGRVYAFGDNTYGQCNVENWQL